MAGSLRVVAVGQSDEERPPRSASPSRKQGIERETAHISAHVYPLEAQDQVWTWPHIGIVLPASRVRPTTRSSKSSRVELLLNSRVACIHMTLLMPVHALLMIASQSRRLPLTHSLILSPSYFTLRPFCILAEYVGPCTSTFFRAQAYNRRRVDAELGWL